MIFHPAIGISQQLNNANMLARSMDNLAHCYAQGVGNFTKALEIQVQSRNIMTNLANPLYESQSLFNLGIMLHYKGQFEEARLTYQQALDVARENHQPLYEALCLASVGTTLGITGKEKEGLQHLIWSRQILSERGYFDLFQIVSAHILRLDKSRKDNHVLEREAFSILQDSYQRQSFYVLYVALTTIIALLIRRFKAGKRNDFLSLILGVEIITMINSQYQEVDFATQAYVGNEMKQLAQQLPQQVVIEAQNQGQALGWWEMAVYLLEELPVLGWGEDTRG